MTWQLLGGIGFGCAFAAGLVISTSSVLALKIGAAAISAWRWCWGRH